MADTPVRFSGPTVLTTSNQIVYIVPQNVQAVLRSIHIVATTSTAQLCLSINGAAAMTSTSSAMFFKQFVPSNTVFNWFGFMPLAPGDTIQALAIGSVGPVLTLCGVEVTS